MVDFPIILLAALIPMALGFVWYNPKMLGTIWMQETGMTPEKGRTGNMPLIFGLSYLFSCFMAMALNVMCTHELGVISLFIKDPTAMIPGSETNNFINSIYAKAGCHFRTFKHGALHGAIGGITLALPIVAINAMFEQKSWKLIAINAGYFIIAMLLMGGVICQFSNPALLPVKP